MKHWLEKYTVRFFPANKTKHRPSFFPNQFIRIEEIGNQVIQMFLDLHGSNNMQSTCFGPPVGLIEIPVNQKFNYILGIESHAREEDLQLLYLFDIRYIIQYWNNFLL